MAPEDAEEFTQSLGQIVGGSWRQIRLADKLMVPKALGLTTRQWVEQRLGGYIRLSIEERREAVVELLEEGLSTREAAEVIGINHSTVVRDTHVLTGADAPEMDVSVPIPGADAPPSDDAADLATLDRVDPDGAERMRLAELRAQWGMAQARQSKALLGMLQILEVGDGEVLAALDEMGRSVTALTPGSLREAADRIDAALEATAGLRIVPGGKHGLSL
jgi:hypothetical protein